MIRELRMRRYRREKANIDVNFVSSNVDECGSQDYLIAMQRKQSSKVRDKRTIDYKVKRSDEVEAKKRYNVLNLSKWDFLRGKRAEFYEQIEERIRNRTQLNMMLIHVYKDQIVKEIFSQFTQRRDEIKIERMTRHATAIISLRYHKIMLRKGPTFDIRLCRQIKYTAMAGMLSVKPTNDKRAG